ncbi:acyltransferase family protein [Hoeflea sp.]|uniref:acyltransferase family protein n=1 Tax=Hoeflea sp. TaxID=1940281 RepID=UPI0019CAE88F|nr:acyltransferase family protein [Hoeflea sp.]MBC7284272.1 acyltransferase [Hoeflea sp.]
MYGENRRFSGNLHALRGLAAVAVVFYHVKSIGLVDTGSLKIVHFLGSGVQLFFILSGFSLALFNFERVDKIGWLRGYALRRMGRILPLWWLFIAIPIVFQGIWHDKSYNWATVLYFVVPMRRT